MFPLSQKRKFARIGKLKISAEILLEDRVETGIIEDLSATGCRISLSEGANEIPVDSEVVIRFEFHNVPYEFKSKKVREGAYKFLQQDRKVLASLNSLVLTDYFKDEPELKEVILKDE